MNIETFEKAKKISDKINKCDEAIENLEKLIANPGYRRIKIGKYGYSTDYVVEYPQFHYDFVKQMLVKIRDAWEKTRQELMKELEAL